jgi:hypothetical protein
MKSKTKPQPEVPFNFSVELKDRQLMHWLGTPCFIKERSKIFKNKVTIVTHDGLIFHKISIKELEPMDLIDLAFI